MTEEERAEKRKQAENRAKAELEKKQGNEHYTKRNFAEAVAHYNKAIELDPTNASYVNNLAGLN